MAGKGGPAQVRRRARRAAARQRNAFVARERASLNVEEFRSYVGPVDVFEVETLDAEPESPDAEPDAEVFADTMVGSCAECSHDADFHMGDLNDGSCGFEGCDCTGFKMAAAIVAAADIIWDVEDGFQDVLMDINEILNPGGDWDYPLFAADVSTDLSRALLCNWAEGDSWVAPIEIGTDREPSLSPKADWIPVEQAWVEANAGYAAKIAERTSRTASAATVVPNQFVYTDAATGVTSTMTLTLNGFMDTGGNPFAGASNPDIPDKHHTRETLPPPREAATATGQGEPDPEDVTGQVDEPEAEDDTRNDDALVDGVPGVGMQWVASIAPEGTPTDDGRIFAPGAITWRELPLSLGAMFDTPHADVVTASPVIGRIDEIWREGNMLFARGIFDDSDLGRDVARMVSDGTLRGVSVDIAVARMEIAWKSEILDGDGNWTGGDGPTDDGPDLVDILFDADPADQVMYVVWEGKIGAVTVCPFPAFADAKIETAKSLVAAASDMVWTVGQQAGWRVVESKPSLVASAAAESVAAVEADETPDGAEDEADALTAAAVDAPVQPPSEWFTNPEFAELTALTVDDEGRVYGHAAPWDTCHIGIPGVCTTAPSSESGYAYFHLKEIECDDGVLVDCGTITLGTGHAGGNMSRAAAAAHYDNTGSAVADVVCGEDDFGIWFSGALRPGLDEKAIREFRGASVSGDWRNVNGSLEFIALLAVNVPGFPVPKVRAMVASGDDGFEVLSLTAAGYGNPPEPLFSDDDAASFEALRDLAAGGWDQIRAEAS